MIKNVLALRIIIFQLKNSSVWSKNDTNAHHGVARRPCYRPKSNKWCSSDWTGVLSRRLGPLLRPSRRKKRRRPRAPKKLPWRRGRQRVRKLQLRCSWLDCFVLFRFFFFFFFPASGFSCRLSLWPFVSNLAPPSFIWLDLFGTTKHV